MIYDQGDYKLQNCFSYHQFLLFKKVVKNKHFKDQINNSLRYLVSDSGQTKAAKHLQSTAKIPGIWQLRQKKTGVWEIFNKIHL